jgi:hypothetical protein
MVTVLSIDARWGFSHRASKDLRPRYYAKGVRSHLGASRDCRDRSAVRGGRCSTAITWRRGDASGTATVHIREQPGELLPDPGADRCNQPDDRPTAGGHQPCLRSQGVLLLHVCVTGCEFRTGRDQRRAMGAATPVGYGIDDLVTPARHNTGSMNLGTPLSGSPQATLDATGPEPAALCWRPS